MLTYQFITRTSTQNKVTTTRTSRGIKTTAEFHAEVQTRLGQQTPAVPLVIQTGLQVILDWTTEGWTIEPLDDPLDDLRGFSLPCGGARRARGRPEKGGRFGGEHLGRELRSSSPLRPSARKRASHL